MLSTRELEARALARSISRVDDLFSTGSRIPLSHFEPLNFHCSTRLCFFRPGYFHFYSRFSGANFDQMFPGKGNDTPGKKKIAWPFSFFIAQDVGWTLISLTKLLALKTFGTFLLFAKKERKVQDRLG